MTLYNDNSVQLQKSDTDDPQVISTIYPPPGAKEVMFFGYCMNLDRIYLVLYTGTICVYRIDETDTSVLERLIYSTDIKDALSKPLSQHITSATFCRTIPPKFDVEVFDEKSLKP